LQKSIPLKLEFTLSPKRFRVMIFPAGIQRLGFKLKKPLHPIPQNQKKAKNARFQGSS
jgi:hypothetical protein